MKKIKKLLVLLALSVLSSNLYAQEIKTYEGMMQDEDIPLEKEMNIGDSFLVTYEYYENEDGSRVRHGKFIVGKSSYSLAVKELSDFYGALDKAAKKAPVTPKYVITDKDGKKVAGVGANTSFQSQIDVLNQMDNGMTFQLIGKYEHGKKCGVWIYRQSHDNRIHVATFVDDKFNGEYCYFPSYNSDYNKENAVRVVVENNVATKVLSFPKGDTEVLQIGGLDAKGGFTGVWKWLDKNGFSTPRRYSAEFVRGVPIWIKYINESTGEMVDDMTPINEEGVKWLREEYEPEKNTRVWTSDTAYKVVFCDKHNYMCNGWNLRYLANCWQEISFFIPGTTRIYLMYVDDSETKQIKHTKELAIIEAEEARKEASRKALEDKKTGLEDVLRKSIPMDKLSNNEYYRYPKYDLHYKIKEMYNDFEETMTEISDDIEKIESVEEPIDEINLRIDNLAKEMTVVCDVIKLPKSTQRKISKKMPEDATNSEIISYLRVALDTINSGGKL